MPVKLEDEEEEQEDGLVKTVVEQMTQGQETSGIQGPVVGDAEDAMWGVQGPCDEDRGEGQALDFGIGLCAGEADKFKGALYTPQKLKRKIFRY